MAGVFNLADCGEPDGQAMPQTCPVPIRCALPVSLPDMDPSLTLTPERLGSEAGILKRGRRGGRRASRQVRFNVSPKSKAGKPREDRDKALVTCTAVPETSCQLTEAQMSSSAEKHRDVKGSKNTRRQKNLRPAVKESSPVGQPEALTEDASRTFYEGAELNTTLAIKAELLDLAGREFDPLKAVHQQLRTSEHTKNNISVRATGGVNIPRSQHLYRELVSVTVSEDQLISQAFHDRLSLAPPTCSHGNKDSPAEGPDLLAFYTPGELLRETPFFPGDELKLPQPRPLPRPSHMTFDLYHKHRQWES